MSSRAAQRRGSLSKPSHDFKTTPRLARPPCVLPPRRRAEAHAEADRGREGRRDQFLHCLQGAPFHARPRAVRGPGVQQGYEIARKYPATLDKIHCFCECAESPMFRHKTLLTCFTDMHAAGCGICLSEARLAAPLKAKGLSDEEIRNTVESVHRTDGHPPTS